MRAELRENPELGAGARHRVRFAVKDVLGVVATGLGLGLRQLVRFWKVDYDVGGGILPMLSTVPLFKVFTYVNLAISFGQHCTTSPSNFRDEGKQEEEAGAAGATRALRSPAPWLGA